MAQQNVTTLGSYLAKALVSPTGGGADETLADIAQAAISVASTEGCGRVELATAGETAAGTEATRAVTPAGLAAQNYIKSTDVTYKALNDNGHVGAGANQVSRGNHGHSSASSTTAGFMSIADKIKLDGIESGATADQTGAEIVTTINTELGGTHWQQGGEGSEEPHTHSAADLPDRGAFYGKALGPSLADNGGKVDINLPGLPAKAVASATDLVPIWDSEAAAHRHVPVAGLPAGRGIKGPLGDDPTISMELPAAVDRRDFLLGFTATGAVTTTKVATAADVDDFAARGMTAIETIEKLRVSPRRGGSTVHVRGYHTAGDGGGGTFMWDPQCEDVENRGTVVAAQGGGIGRWKRITQGGPISVKWFGARGDFKTNDTIAIQAALDAAGENGVVYLPTGRYLVTSTLTLPSKVTLRGDSEASVIWAVNISGPVLKANDACTDKTKGSIAVQDLNIGGKATSGIQLIKAQESRVTNVVLSLQAVTDALYIVDCWGLRIEKVRIYGVSGRSCIYLHRPSGAGGNHAVSIDRIYTSSATPIGILIDSDTGAIASIGVNISNCTLQGHGTAALICLQASGISISGLYTEHTGIPIQLGDQSKNKWASNINVSGSTFMTYKTPITLDACTGVVFSGCNLNVNGLSSVWIRYKYARNISIISCTPNNIRDGIRRMSNARSEHGLTILQGSWDGPPDWPAKSTPAMLILRAINTGGVAHQHFCMSVDSTGAWVAEEWIPLQEM